MKATTLRRRPRVAIVSDTMVQTGGAERVVETLAEVFPDAAIFTLLYDPVRGPSAIRGRVTESWLRRFPAATTLAKALLPLYPSAIESFDLDEYDVIISSHHTLAKGVLRNAEQVHLCYCHTPMRSLWERPHREVDRVPGMLRPLMRFVLAYLRGWDYCAASRVDYFIANSDVTAERIAKHYHRRSRVVPPPIDTERFTPGGVSGDFYLVASRNVPYKRIDLAIEAAERLGRRLIVVGDRTDSLVRPSDYVSFYGRVSDSRLITLMRGARALINPQFEDFGMTVLEMNACGRPVIAYAKGGSLETVIDGRTGILFEEQTVESLVAAIERFEETAFDSSVIRRHAESFSKRRFGETMRRVVDEALHRGSIFGEVDDRHGLVIGDRERNIVTVG